MVKIRMYISCVPDALANIFFIAALMRPLKLGSISRAGVVIPKPTRNTKREKKNTILKEVPIRNDLLKFI